MPLEYRKNGVHFFYPDNWNLDDIPLEEGNFAVELNSPDGAFWMLTVSNNQSPEDLAESARNALAAEYRDLESVPTTKMIAGRMLNGFDMDFMCFDLVNTAMVLTFSDNDRTYAIFWQADDQLLSQSREDVFNAITFSLLERLS